jgi:CBS domain-containing protein
MLVERLLTPARARLVTIADDAPMIEAAKLLRAGTDLVVVCGSAGLLVGVITKTDVVGQISRCQGASCTTAASLVMTRDVLLCRTGDWLRDVWARMKERSLKNIPVVDQDSRPLGVLNARDALQVLLEEVQDEEALLRDYVMGVGYH